MLRGSSGGDLSAADLLGAWTGTMTLDGEAEPIALELESAEGDQVALDRSTGRAVWRYAAEPPEEGAWGFPGSPAVGAGHVFVSGVDGRVLAFEE